MLPKELESKLIQAVIASAKTTIGIISIRYEIHFKKSEDWHYIKCHDMQKLIEVNDRYRARKDCDYFQVYCIVDARKKIGPYLDSKTTYIKINITESFYLCKGVCKGGKS